MFNSDPRLFQNRLCWRELRGPPIGGLPSRGARIFQKEETICEIPITFGQISARLATKIAK